MSNKYWLKQEQVFLNAISSVEIPNEILRKVDSVIVKNKKDLNEIPDGGGCYWIWTNEPVEHSLHKNETPKIFNNGEVIYNGIAKDDVKGRLFHHLFGYLDAGWSGISLDIYTKKSKSHRKKACSSKGKIPFIRIDNIYYPVKTKNYLLKLHLSSEEKEYIKKTNSKTFFFRNGIDIKEKKHRKFIFKVFYITGLTSIYLEYIEKEWRRFGLPKLCSYSSGR